MSVFTPTPDSASIMSTPKENDMSPSNAPPSPSKRAMIETPKNHTVADVNSFSVVETAGLPAEELASSETSEVTEEAASESEEEKLLREQAESEKLARMLMAEEAEQSFALQYDMLQSATADMDGADLVAVQALLRADEEAQNAMRGGQPQEGAAQELFQGEEGEEDDEEDEGEEGEGGEGATYDELIELGRNIGDVKAERWGFKAQAVIDALPTCAHCCKPEDGKECAYDLMCIFCRDDYNEGDTVRTLPCKHAFHAECVDEWLLANNSCPMCKRPVVEDEDEEQPKEDA